MKPQIVLKFTVFGKAEPAGSKRAYVPINKETGKPYEKNGRVVVSVVDDNKKSRPWKALVSDAAQMQWGARLPLTGPLYFKATFYVDRPKGHYGSGKNAAVLKASSPAMPASKPDVLKLTRGVEDALTGIVWKDDAQIVDERIAKRYDDRPRVEVEIGILPGTIEEARAAMQEGATA